MTQIKLLPQQINLLFAISFTLITYTPVQAQLVNPLLLRQYSALNANEPFNKRLIFAAPPPPSNTGAPERRSEAGGYAAPPPPSDIGEPGQRSGAGSRGCIGDESLAPSSEKQLTALMPVYSGSELVFGVTTAEHPTLGFYVPYPRPATGKFVLQDQEGNPVYKTDVTLPEKPGVVSLSLPPTAPPLEPGKLYHWYFKVYCQPQQPPFYVDGWIRRDSLNSALERQLEQATPQQRVALYAANGIWHEALTTAAELRRTDPNASEWATLLRDVGLDAIATEPIIE